MVDAMMTSPNNLPAWLAWLETLHIKNIDMSLERIRMVANKLAVNTFSCPIITIGGTNGKGSTVALLEAIYLKGGYRVGAYTSPHIIQFNERIRLNGQSIDDEAIVNAFQIIEAARGETTLTFFEYTTLAALIIFKQSNLDIILLEVGLGGRLDAVNIIDSDIAIVTSIALDHMEWLGNTREEIAVEKAGIFRRNKIAICGDPDPPKTLIDEAINKGAILYCQGQDFGFRANTETQTWEWRGLSHVLTDIPQPQLAIQNISTALLAYYALEKLPLNETALIEAITDTTLMGRFECIHDNPLVIVDVAHNPAAAAMLAQQITEKLSHCDKVVAVFSALSDKDVVGIVANLSNQIREWYIAPLSTSRSCHKDNLLKKTQQGGAEHIKMYDSIQLAYQAAALSCTSRSAIVVFGSFYTVAEIYIQGA